MTKSIARGFARKQIFAVCPGFTMTGMAGLSGKPRWRQAAGRHPAGPGGDARKVATLIRFCALEAPPSMTGAVLDINGASYVR